MKKKLTVTFTVSDIFVSSKEKRTFATIYLNQTLVNRRDSKIIYIGLSYHFGKTKKMPKRRKVAV